MFSILSIEALGATVHAHSDDGSLRDETWSPNFLQENITFVQSVFFQDPSLDTTDQSGYDVAR